MEKIVQVACEVTGVELTENETMKESGLDSLALVTLIASIEEEFGFSFDDDDLQPENLQMLSDLVRITEKYV
ncbi:MAG: acyl carrier protein [Clostridiales bacterium]|nr:acyl carrier protein [Clostridiales bacterium]